MTDASNEVSRGLQDELESLWRFALKLTGNEDESADLVQRTCLRALEQRGNYVARGKLRSWLFRIEHRIWLNELRSQKLRNHRSLTLVHDAEDDSVQESTLASDPSETLSPEGNVLLHQIHHAVESLSENQRIVMLLVCVEGFTYAEAADILELPVGTIMSRLARGRIAIGKKMLPAGNQRDSKDAIDSSTSARGGE